jgi:hypothetical protein
MDAIVPGYRVSDQQPYTFISPAIYRAIRSWSLSIKR